MIKRGDGVADPDAPNDPNSTRFWVTTGAKFTDRERVGVSMEANAAIKTTADTVGAMLGGPENGSGWLALTNGAPSTASSSAGGASLEALVGIMTGNGNGEAMRLLPKQRQKPRPKPKRRQQQQQSTCKLPKHRQSAGKLFATWFLIGMKNQTILHNLHISLHEIHGK